jgi:hypothetical protein
MPTTGPTRRRAGFVAITFVLSIGLAQTVPDTLVPHPKEAAR